MKKFMAYCLISVALLSCTTLDTTRPTEAKVKNVIMIIGDGMGWDRSRSDYYCLTPDKRLMALSLIARRRWTA